MKPVGPYLDARADRFAGPISFARRLARQPRAIPFGLAVLAFLLAFVQRPGKAVTDARIELTADPSLFLSRVDAVWSPTGDLGHVQSSQFVGYLFPTGPWYAFADWVGIPDWVAQRLWLGAILALAAWGVVRLMDELYSRERGLAHLVAGLLFAVNPYVVVFTSRATITLVALAALPWLLVATHRGLRNPRRWRWPAFLGLVLGVAGGGVNAALMPWLLAAIAALAIYEAAVLDRTWRAVGSFALRAAPCAAVGSAWWAIPVLLGGTYGADFLQFTEQPTTIWATNSMSESLRLLGFWLVYLTVGVGELKPLVAVAPTYLFNEVVVLASFLVPLVAFAGLRWTRRWSWAQFFGLLAVLALVVMSAGFPADTPMRRAMTWGYDNFEALRFLRTTYKAGPLLALSIACLAGAALPELVQRARNGGLSVAGRRLPGWPVLVLAVLPALWAAPLFTGRAIDRPLAYGEIPSAWKEAMADADRTTPPDRRTMIVPGEGTTDYRWGETTDAVGPALAKRPVAIRGLTRYSDARSSQLQTTVDDAISQARLVPGQLDPLLGLMGVGQVVLQTDARYAQLGGLAETVDWLRLQPGFERGVEDYGEPLRFRPALGRSGPVLTLPELRRHSAPAGGAGIVRAHPAQGATILDGDADGVLELAATGGLDPGRLLVYAGDLHPAAAQDLVRQGGRLVFSDSSRRRAIAGGARGPTLGPDDPLPARLPSYELFPERGAAAQTVASYPGLRYLRAPELPTFSFSPHTRAYAAFDGRTDTSWIANIDDPGKRYVELALERPRPVGAIRVRPHNDVAGLTSAIAVSVNGGPERGAFLQDGWNTVPIVAGELRTLRIRVQGVTGTGQGGLAEVQIPGLDVRETLRLPTWLAFATDGLDLSRNDVEVLLQRTTASFPYRTGGNRGDMQLGSPVTQLDAEPGLEREVTLPVARAFEPSGWASVAPGASDGDIDRLAGRAGELRFRSSSRFEGVPGRRASSAFDGDADTAWVGDHSGGEPAWIAFDAPRPVTVRRLRLVRAAPEYPFPTFVKVSAGGRRSPSLPVRRDGSVVLPRPVSGRSVRIDVDFVGRAGREDRGYEAVGLGEVVVPGLTTPAPPRSGRFSTRCGEIAVRAGASRAGALVSGRIEDLDAGRPLRIAPCGTSRLALPAGAAHVSAAPGAVMQPDHLRLLSAAATGGGAALPAPRVLDPGKAGDGERDGVRLDAPAGSWLVLAESYSRGWRAWCGERALGEPVPVDGFANGWQLPAGCAEARIAFGPQGVANASYALSAVGGAGLLALVLAGRRRSRRRSPALASGAAPELLTAVPPDPELRYRWTATLVTAAAIGVAAAGLFALRAGAALALITVVLMRTEVSVRRLVRLVVLAIAAIAFLYLAFPVPEAGNVFFRFATQSIASHWLGVLAVSCLAAACALDAFRLRRTTHRRRGRSRSR